MFKSSKRLKVLHYLNYFTRYMVLAVMTLTSCLENETVTQIITDAITTIRNNSKRPDGQSVFEYIRKTAATKIYQKYITSVIEVILNKNVIYDKPSKKLVFT